MLDGRFYPAQARRRGMSVHLADDTVETVCRNITGQSCPEICINDTKNCDHIYELFEKAAAAFETLLPEKSSFEKFPPRKEH